MVKMVNTYRTVAVFVVLVCLSMFLAAPGILGAKADPNSGDDALIVLENSTNKRWTQLSHLNIFANSKYGGLSMIAPMSSGKYEFTVRNSARFPLKYEMKISDKNDGGVPMEFRLKQSGEYIAGGDSRWVGVADMSEISSNLPSESESIYTLEWRWLGDNDKLDTSIGVAARQRGVEYVLNLGIFAEQDDETLNFNNSLQSPDTGNNIDIALWIALAASLVTTPIIFTVVKCRKSVYN